MLGAVIPEAAPARGAWVVSITGTWNADAPVTPYSAPLEPFSVYIRFPSQTFSTIYQDANISVTTDMTAVRYTLDGVAVPVTLWTGPQADCFGLAVGTLCNVAFFDTALDGGMAVAFSDHVVEFYGADIGSTGTLVRGEFPFVPNMDDSLVNEGTALASVTPEPGAWAMMLLGVGAIGGAARAVRSRRAAA
jgi:hypothetical protein